MSAPANKGMNQMKPAQDCGASRLRFTKAGFTGYAWCYTNNCVNNYMKKLKGRTILIVCILIIFSVILIAQQFYVSTELKYSQSVIKGTKLTIPTWLDIGKTIPSNYRSIETKLFFFSDGFYDQYPLTYNGIDIIILSNYESHGRAEERIVDAIVITTPNVMIDAIYIGEEYKTLKQKINNEDIMTLDGFGSYAKLPSGWNAILYEGKSQGENLKDSTKVVAFAVGGRWNHLPDNRLK